MPSNVKDILRNPTLRKQLAKFMALHCFRNSSQLDYLHSGITPSSQSGDSSDVKVVTPYGEIPWVEAPGAKKVSRISDEEMKVLMINVVDKTYETLTLLADDDMVVGLNTIFRAEQVLPNWNEPEERDPVPPTQEGKAKLLTALAMFSS